MATTTSLTLARSVSNPNGAVVEAVPEVVPPDIGFLFPDESFFRKCVLLIDGTSPLPGREKHQAECFDDIQRHGMRAATCADDRG